MRKKAFTLVELLVVLAIIATLLSILVPALLRARTIAERVTCVSNLRQMYIASQNYAASNDDYYPLAYEKLTVGSTSFENYWDFMDGKFGRGMPGFLWEFQKLGKIPWCPTFGNSAKGNPVTAYNYNSSYIGGTWIHQGTAVSKGPTSGTAGVLVVQTPANPSVSATEKFRPSARLIDVKHPTSCAIFGDGQNAEGAVNFMLSPLDGLLDADLKKEKKLQSFNGTQGFRHTGKANVAYCDGSVISEKECFTKIVGNAVDRGRIAAGTGFLSADNSSYDRE